MEPNASSSGKERLKGGLLGLLLLVLALVPLAAPGVRKAAETKAAAQLSSCGLKEPAAAFACYREGLDPIVKRQGPEEAARRCLDTGDPLCAEAFGSLAPDQSWCQYLRPGGLPFLRSCLETSCR